MVTEFLDGITLLNTKTVNVLISPYSDIIFWSLLICFSVVLVSSIFAHIKKIGLISICIISVLAGTCCYCGMCGEREPVYTYEVIIDDTVSFNEMYEKYEVVEVNGEIYSIKIKEKINYGETENQSE